MDVQAKFESSLIGLAVCDALGTAVEFMPRGTFEEVTDLRGGGKFDLLPGQWTDDTSMALCLCESLIECGGFDASDQCSRYCHWFEDGHLSSTGECFDIGMTTQKALYTFKRTSNPFSGPTGAKAAGNGCLMRLAPVPLAYWQHPLLAMNFAGDSARTTHGAQAAVDACKYYAGLIIGCLHGESKETLLSPKYSPPGANDYWPTHTMVEEVESIAKGSYKKISRECVKSTGYIVHSMEAALWAFYNSSTFEEGALLAVNLGDDADTVGAIYGQLAGAHYGTLPQRWVSMCSFSVLIKLFAGELLELSKNMNTPSHQQPVSPKYREMKMDYFDNLEAESREILRRSSPCPKQYKTLEEFDSAIDRIKSKYRELSLDKGVEPKGAESWKDALLSDFNKQWIKLRKKLSLRIERGKV